MPTQTVRFHERYIFTGYPQRQLPFPLKRNLSYSRHRCQSIIKIIFPRRCFRRLQRESIAQNKACFFAPLPRLFSLSRAGRALRERVVFWSIFSRADLAALTRERLSLVGFVLRKNRFSIPNKSRVVYRDGGLFFGAVKIENDAAQALRLSP